MKLKSMNMTNIVHWLTNIPNCFILTTTSCWSVRGSWRDQSGATSLSSWSRRGSSSWRSSLVSLRRLILVSLNGGGRCSIRWVDRIRSFLNYFKLSNFRFARLECFYVMSETQQMSWMKKSLWRKSVRTLKEWKRLWNVLSMNLRTAMSGECLKLQRY